jgi:UDP-3-O-[3-hydroxymyristoyl] N-acetylglucosamine deacetylase/3-hydroxyacyl-[acyl-carrier-protein] dehydratase
MKQCTIGKEISLSGIGLHLGKIVNITFVPAEINLGIKFVRVDLEDKPVIPADISKVITTNRGTTLQNGNAQVHTVEHVLSALMGLGIDNLTIELDGPEIPILDGSAIEFVKAIQKAGILEQDAEREYFEILEPISYKDELTGSELVALPDDEFNITSMIDFNSPVLGQQYATLNHMNDYVVEIAACRTFVFLHELEKLINQGLIKGGDLDNAIVIVDRKMDEAQLAELSKKLNKPNVKVEKEGVLNTTDLKYKNEPARHKLLDVIGDLSLIGKPIKGKIVATKPGHSINIEFAKILKKLAIEQKKNFGVPKYDLNATPKMNINEIMELLPHRYPFLLVDKVLDITHDCIYGLKNVTMNEGFFQGHFPNNPVFPGVLQIEAMAQTGGLFALSLQEDSKGWDTYFLKIDNCKFKHKVLPGDTLIIKMQLLMPIRRGIVQMQGTIYVGNKVVSEAELTAQIVKRNN